MYIKISPKREVRISYLLLVVMAFMTFCRVGKRSYAIKKLYYNDIKQMQGEHDFAYKVTNKAHGDVEEEILDVSISEDEGKVLPEEHEQGVIVTEILENSSIEEGNVRSLQVEEFDCQRDW
jgi:hypothetical protein